MMHEFLWYVRLWLTGVYALVLMPFVFAWSILIEGPIALGKRINNERED